MDIKLLKSNIMSNNIPNFLIFVEHEHALCKQYIQAISDTTNLAYSYFDTADHVIYQIETNLSDNRIYVIYNDVNVLNDELKLDKLFSLNKYIIIVVDSFDKSSCGYKKYKNHYVNFEKLDMYTILAYVTKLCTKNAIDVSQDKLLKLIDQCNCDLSAVLNEFDKIITLGQSNSNVLTSYMLDNGFSDFREVGIAKIVTKVCNRDLTVFSDIYKTTESPVSILFALYTTFRQKLQQTGTLVYATYMELCSFAYNSILDGTMLDKCALKYVLFEVLK